MPADIPAVSNAPAFIARAADSAALADCAQSAYNVAFQILRSPADAEDAAQTALLKALRPQCRFQDGLHLRRWVTRVAMHDALKILQTRRRAQPLPAESTMPATRQENAGHRELLDRLHAHIAAMDEAPQALLVEHYYNKKTLTTLAREERVSETAIWKRMQRALDDLRGTLAKEGYASSMPLISGALESLEPAAAPPQLLQAGKLAALAVGLPAQGLAAFLGGLSMTVKTSLSIAALALLLLGFFGGWGGHAWLGQPAATGSAESANAMTPESSTAPARAADGAEDRAAIDRLEAELRRMTGENRELKTQYEAAQLEIARLSAPEASPVNIANTPKNLEERLAALQPWYSDYRNAMMELREQEKRNPGAKAAEIATLKATLYPTLDGLREQILLEPEAFIRFLQACDDASFLGLVFQELAQQREVNGQWHSQQQYYEEMPRALMQGLLAAMCEGSVTQRSQTLYFLSDCAGLPAEYVESAHSLLQYPEPTVQAASLRFLSDFVSTKRIWGEAFPGIPESMVPTIADLYRQAIQNDDRALINETIAAILQTDGAAAERFLLEQLRVCGNDYALLRLCGTLFNRAKTASRELIDDYVDTLSITLSPKLRRSQFCYLIRAALQLNDKRALTVLQAGLGKKGDAIDAALRQTIAAMEQGETRSQVLLPLFGNDPIFLDLNVD